MYYVKIITYYTGINARDLTERYPYVSVQPVPYKNSLLNPKNRSESYVTAQLHAFSSSDIQDFSHDNRFFSVPNAQQSSDFSRLELCYYTRNDNVISTSFKCMLVFVYNGQKKKKKWSIWGMGNGARVLYGKQKKKKYVRTLKKKKNTKIHNYFLLSKRKKNRI